MSEQLGSSLRRSARLAMDTESETESFSNDSSVHGNSMADLRYAPARTASVGRRDGMLNLKDPSYNEYDGEQAYTESESDGPDRSGRRRRSSKGKHRQAALPPKLKEMLSELQERGVPKNPREEDIDLEYLDSILEQITPPRRRFSNTQRRTRAEALNIMGTVLVSHLGDHRVDRDRFLYSAQATCYLMSKAPDMIPTLANQGAAEVFRDNLIAVDPVDVMTVDRCLDNLCLLTKEDYDCKSRVGTRSFCQKLVELLEVFKKDVMVVLRICSCIYALVEVSSIIASFREARLPEHIPGTLQTLVDMNTADEEHFASMNSSGSVTSFSESTPGFQDVHVSAIKTCLDCITLIAKGNSKSQYVLIEARLAHTIAQLMRRWGSDADLQIKACQAISAFTANASYAELDNQNEPDIMMVMHELIEADIPTRVADAIIALPDHRGLFAAGLKAVASLSTLSRAREIFLSPRLIRALLAGLYAFQVDRDIQHIGLMAIIQLLQEGEHAQDELVQQHQNVCKVIHKVMVTFPNDHHVMRRAFSAMAKLAAHQGAREKFVLDNICSTMVEQLSRYIDSEEMLGYVLENIQSLSFGDAKMLTNFAQARLCQVLRQVPQARRFTADSALPHRLCDVIMVMCGAPEYQDKLGQEGFCDVVVGLMQQLTNRPDVVICSLNAAYHLALRNGDNQRKLGAAGCCEATQAALLLYPDLPELVELALVVFHVLAFDGLNRTTLGQIEAHDLVISAMNRYLDDKKIQQRGIQVLWTMALNHPPNRFLIGNSAGCETILRGVEEYKSDEAIIQASLDAIQQLALSPDNQHRLSGNYALFQLLIRVIQQSLPSSGKAGTGSPGSQLTKETSRSSKHSCCGFAHSMGRVRHRLELLRASVETCMIMVWENSHAAVTFSEWGGCDEVVKVLNRQLSQSQADFNSITAHSPRSRQSERRVAQDDEGRAHEIEIKAACLTIVTHLAAVNETMQRLIECGAVHAVYAAIQPLELSKKAKTPTSPTVRRRGPDVPRVLAEKACEAIAKLCENPACRVQFGETRIALVLFKCLRRFKMDHVVCALVMVAIKACTNGNPLLRDEFMKQEFPEKLVALACERHPDDKDLQYASIEALRTLLQGNVAEHLERIGKQLEEKEYKLILPVLSQPNTDPSLTDTVIATIELIDCLASVQYFSTSMGANGIPEALITTLSSNFNYTIQEAGWKATLRMLEGTANKNAFGRAKILEAIQKFFQVFPIAIAKTQLIKLLLQILASLAVIEANRTEFMGQVAMHEIILALLYKYQNSDELVLECANTIQILSHNVQLRRYFYERGVHVFVDMLSQAYDSMDPTSVARLVGVVYSLCVGERQENMGLLSDLDALLPVLHAVMRTHNADREVQTQCCSILGIVSALPHMLPDFVQDFGPLVVASLQKFADYDNLCSPAAKVVWLMCAKDPSYRKRIGELGVIPTLLQVMRNFPNHLPIQQHCCAALWELAEDRNFSRIIGQEGGLELVRTSTVNCPQPATTYYAFGTVQVLLRDPTNAERFHQQPNAARWLEACAEQLHIRPDDQLRSTEDVRTFIARRMLVFPVNIPTYPVTSRCRAADGTCCCVIS